MAKEAKPEATATETAAPPKKSKKLLIIVIALVLVLLVVGGGAAFFLMRKHNTQDGENGEVATEKAKSAKEVPPVYVALDAFTVNLVPENGEQFLQLIVSVEVANIQVGDKLKAYTPKLRNNVMLLLSAKKPSELMTREGKEKLANEIRDLMNAVIDPGGKNKENETPVKEVLFTSFIIQ